MLKIKRMKKTKRKKILCVCAKGLNRSKYLAKYLKNKSYNTRYGGLEPYNPGEKIPNPITQEDVDWADVIIIIRKRLNQKFEKNFKRKGKKKIIIDVTDSMRLLPKEYHYLRKKGQKAFEKEWREPQLRKAIKPYLPL